MPFVKVNTVPVAILYWNWFRLSPTLIFEEESPPTYMYERTKSKEMSKHTVGLPLGADVIEEDYKIVNED